MGLRGPLMLWLLWVLRSFSSSGVFGEKEKVNGLELHFYRDSCPGAEMIVKQEMKRNILQDPTSAASLLRLAFHDCQVNGCDGSVLLRDSNSFTAETASEKNFGIRKLDAIDGIKSSIEEICPQTVSCADIIQLAAREAIYLSGGPYIKISTGRRDSVFASKERADQQLPSADISVDELIEIFQQKNITVEDGVALMGAHTLGVSHCRNFKKRLRPRRDPTMSPIYSFMLKIICSVPSLSNVAFATNDATVFSFDNRYFIDIQQGRGLLTIDSEISRDPRTLTHVVSFGRDRRHFFDRFSYGFLKLSGYKVLLGEEGEIRKDCMLINS